MFHALNLTFILRIIHLQGLFEHQKMAKTSRAEVLFVDI